jgi:FAD:protein FMN transferase
MIVRAFRSEPFRAMGTSCAVGASAAPAESRLADDALAAARREIDACERALSRFDPASELSALNAAAGTWAAAGPRLVEALRAALEARAASGGRYDPTVLPAVVAAGYDRSFEDLGDARPPAPIAGWRAGAAVEVDPARGRARVAAGAAVDLGGIGKGWSAARALEAMRAAWPGLPGGLVDLGGDIAVWGRPPGGGAWRVAVADPRRSGGHLGTLHVAGGGVATSGRDRRRFGPGRALHHLIDPRTGRPARGGSLTVTVVADAAEAAEAHATALAVTPTDEAAAYVAERPGLAALLVPDEGPPLALGPLPLVRPALAEAAS